MAISPMQKVYILALRDDKDRLLEEIQKANLMQIETDLLAEIEEEMQEKEIFSQDVELKISQVEYVIDYLKPFEKKMSIKEQLESAAAVVSYEDFKNISKRVHLDTIYGEVYDSQHESRALAAEENELISRLARIEPYRVLKVDFDLIKDTAHVMMRVGMIKQEAFKDFHLNLADLGNAITLHMISEGYQGFDYFYLAYHKDYHADIDKILARYNYRDEDVKISGTPLQEIERINQRLTEIKKQGVYIERESALKADWLDRLRVLSDYLVSVRDRKRADSKIYETRATFAVKGWILKKDIEALESHIKQVTGSYEMIVESPGKDDEVPVQMSNSSVVSPMEFVTSLYGTPNYKENDPTGYIFPFFILFFSICMSDFGYGLVLLIASLVLLKYMKNSKLLKVVLYGSAMTLVTGFIMGGFWAINYNDLPAFIRSHAIDINSNALAFLTFTVFLGITQMVYGSFIGAKLAWDRGEKHDAIERGLKGLILLGGAPIMVLMALMNTKLPSPLDVIFLWVALISIVLFLIARIIGSFADFKFEGPAPAMILRFVMVLLQAVILNSVLELANTIIGFLGVMLSYSRLMALGLSSGGIGMVVNLLGGLARELVPIPILGALIGAVIIVFGHIFNILISVLGAFIHTARLQYVEFFPFFFEGGGRQFDPFGIKTKYKPVATE